MTGSAGQGVSQKNESGVGRRQGNRAYVLISYLLAGRLSTHQQFERMNSPMSGIFVVLHGCMIRWIR